MTISNISKFAVAAVSLVAAGMLNANVAKAASDDGAASAVVAAPITITAGTDMNFGNIGVSTTGGTAVLSTAGAVTVTGDVTALSGVTTTAGVFALTGFSNSAYSLTIPSTVTLNSGVNSMVVSSLTNDAGGSPALTSGTGSINVGGTLTVAASQAAGNYSGTYTVTVNYQ